MTDEARKDLIEKIRAILAMTSSTNENEAAVAAEMARKLLQKYNLSMVEIEQPFTVDDIDEAPVFGMISNKLQTWEIDLAFSVVKAFYCHLLRQGDRLLFVGLPVDIAVAMSTYAYLRQVVYDEALKSMRKYDAAFKERYGFSAHHATGSHNAKVYRFSWIQACTRRLAHRLDEMIDAGKSDPNENAIVLVRDGLIKSYLASKKLGKGQQLEYSNGYNSQGYAAGARFGDTIPLQPDQKILPGGGR